VRVTPKCTTARAPCPSELTDGRAGEATRYGRQGFVARRFSGQYSKGAVAWRRVNTHTHTYVLRVLARRSQGVSLFSPEKRKESKRGDARERSAAGRENTARSPDLVAGHGSQPSQQLVRLEHLSLVAQ
jgi:hypothetical protein